MVEIIKKVSSAPPKDIKRKILRREGCNLVLKSNCKLCSNYEDCVRYTRWREAKAEKLKKKSDLAREKSREAKKVFENSSVLDEE